MEYDVDVFVPGWVQWGAVALIALLAYLWPEIMKPTLAVALAVVIVLVAAGVVKIRFKV